MKITWNLMYICSLARCETQMKNTLFTPSFLYATSGTNCYHGFDREFSRSTQCLFVCSLFIITIINQKGDLPKIKQDNNGECGECAQVYQRRAQVAAPLLAVKVESHCMVYTTSHKTDGSVRSYQKPPIDVVDPYSLSEEGTDCLRWNLEIQSKIRYEPRIRFRDWDSQLRVTRGARRETYTSKIIFKITSI